MAQACYDGRKYRLRRLNGAMLLLLRPTSSGLGQGGCPQGFRNVREALWVVLLAFVLAVLAP